MKNSYGWFLYLVTELIEKYEDAENSFFQHL